MHRRQLLVFAAAGLAHASLGARADSGHDDDRVAPAAPGAPPCDFELALGAARAAGKPLLVLLAPDARPDDAKRHDALAARRDLFGQLLTLASDEAMAELLLCELVCAPLADVRTHVPGVRALDDALVLLVETGVDAPAVRALADDLAPVGRLHFDRLDHDERVRTRVIALEARLRALLVPDLRALERRAADCRAALSPAEGVLLRLGAQRPAELPPELAAQGAAVVLLAAAGSPERAARVTLLARLAIERLRKRPPRGAKWGCYDSCGVSIEGECRLSTPCGTAFTSELSQRFLHYYRLDLEPRCGH